MGRPAPSSSRSSVATAAAQSSDWRRSARSFVARLSTEFSPERSAASMSHGKTASGGRATKKPGRSLVVPVLAVVAACLVFILNVVLFVGWYRTKRVYDGLRKEKAQLDASNRLLADAYGLLHNKKVQICNRSSADVTVHWVSVIYEDAGR